MTEAVEGTSPGPADQRRDDGPFYIPSLDGIRAVAVMIVFISHAGLEVVPGGFGVTVFFFLSGYLITTLLRREFTATGRLDIRAFYLRRAWRILPPFYLCLALAIVFRLVGFTFEAGNVAGTVAQALHFTNYWQLIDPAETLAFVPGTTVYWSLAVEEHFYLIFPLAALLLLRRYPPRRQAAILLAVCGAVLVWRLILVVGFDASINRTYAATDARIDAILFGCAMGLWRNPVLDPVIATTRRFRWGAIVAAGAVILVSMAIREEVYRETVRYTIQSVALFPIFYVAITHPSEGVLRVLNLRPVRYLGVLSYTFYLNHLVYIYGFNHQFPDTSRIVTGALSFVAILLTSMAIHRWVEQPVADIRRRLRVTPTA